MATSRTCLANFRNFRKAIGYGLFGAEVNVFEKFKKEPLAVSRTASCGAIGLASSGSEFNELFLLNRSFRFSLIWLLRLHRQENSEAAFNKNRAKVFGFLYQLFKLGELDKDLERLYKFQTIYNDFSRELGTVDSSDSLTARLSNLKDEIKSSSSNLVYGSKVTKVLKVIADGLKKYGKLIPRYGLLIVGILGPLVSHFINVYAIVTSAATFVISAFIGYIDSRKAHWNTNKEEIEKNVDALAYRMLLGRTITSDVVTPLFDHYSGKGENGLEEFGRKLAESLIGQDIKRRRLIFYSNLILYVPLTFLAVYTYINSESKLNDFVKPVLINLFLD